MKIFRRNRFRDEEGTVYPPKRYLFAYGVGLVISFYPLTQYAPVDEFFPAALAISGALFILTSVYAGRGIYPHQPLATLPHYLLNGAVFSGLFGVVLLIVAGMRALFG